MYSIYAWGIFFILNVVCAILDIPNLSKHLSASPEVCVKAHEFAWFTYRGMVYFYVPVGASVIINICFFIALMLRIWYHEYVKLSLVLGISWIMKIILWLTDIYVLHLANVDTFLELVAWHTAEVMDIFQGVILFFAFVWKKRIMLLLLKRFGYQIREPVMNILMNDCPCASSSPTTLVTAEIVPMQEISLPNQ